MSCSIFPTDYFFSGSAAFPVRYAYGVTSEGAEAFIPNVPNFFFFRNLKDQIWNGGFDWAMPLSVRDPHDGEIKTGVLFRSQFRDFTAATYTFQSNGSNSAISGRTSFRIA